MDIIILWTFLFVVSFTPAILLTVYQYNRDFYTEPIRPVLNTFLMGMMLPALLLVVPRLSIEDLMIPPGHPFIHSVIRSFISVALIEEGFKFLVILLYATRQEHFDEPMDGLVYGVAASMGFASLENLAYATQEDGFYIALFRAFTAVPQHWFLGAIMGYYVGEARIDREHFGRLAARGLIVPVILHGLYNLPLFLLEQQGREVSLEVIVLIMFVAGVFIFEYFWTAHLREIVGKLQIQWYYERNSFEARKSKETARMTAKDFPSLPRWRLQDTPLVWLEIFGGGLLITLGCFLFAYPVCCWIWKDFHLNGVENLFFYFIGTSLVISALGLISFGRGLREVHHHKELEESDLEKFAKAWRESWEKKERIETLLSEQRSSSQAPPH